MPLLTTHEKPFLAKRGTEEDHLLLLLGAKEVEASCGGGLRSRTAHDHVRGTLQWWKIAMIPKM